MHNGLIGCFNQIWFLKQILNNKQTLQIAVLQP